MGLSITDVGLSISELGLQIQIWPVVFKLGTKIGAKLISLFLL